MTNDELKKKIIETLKNTVVNYDCGHAIIAGYFYMEKVFVAFADALIAAGIGDVKAAEHRAEVAKKALERTVVELLLARGYSALSAVIRAQEFFIPESIKEAEKELEEAEE